MKDRFKDWNLLHKSVVAVLAALFVGVAVRAIVAIDAGFELKHEAVVPYATSDVWSLITSNKGRIRWQGQLVDIQRLTGEPTETGSTRLIFWKVGYKAWHAVEQTREVLPERVFATIQESDKDHRWFRVELTPEGDCSTRVKISEIIRPVAYNKRFWFFREMEEHEAKWDASFEALERWLATSATACKAGEEAS